MQRTKNQRFRGPTATAFCWPPEPRHAVNTEAGWLIGYLATKVADEILRLHQEIVLDYLLRVPLSHGSFTEDRWLIDANDDAFDDRHWLVAHPSWRYRLRPAAGGAWVVMRVGRGVFLQTFVDAAQLSAAPVPDDDAAIARLWEWTAYPWHTPPPKEKRPGQDRGASRRP